MSDTRDPETSPTRDRMPATAAFYVALVAKHEEEQRREMRARIDRRSAASRVAWTIALVFVLLATLAATASAKPARDRDDDTMARDARGAARDERGRDRGDRDEGGRATAARRIADASHDDDRDDGDRERDDERDDDERDDDNGIALELDANRGATTGGPGRWRAPAIAEVLEAAYDAAGLNHDPTRAWSWRARVAGVIPWISVKTGWDQSWHDDEPGDVGRSRTFEVRATWRLDRLLFDGRELQMSTIDTARRRERRRLASRVIRAYFVWRKVVPRGGLAAEAAMAELDALTDGWFSERAKSGR